MTEHTSPEQQHESTDGSPPAEGGPGTPEGRPAGDAHSESPPSSARTSSASATPATDEIVREIGEAATRLGGLLGRAARRTRVVSEQFIHDAQPEVERLAQRARPEAERLARRTKAAADAAKPHLRRAGEEAARYVREHDAEIKQAAITSASIASRRVVPPTLRPVVDALGLTHVRPPLRQPPPPAAPADAEGESRTT